MTKQTKTVSTYWEFQDKRVSYDSVGVSDESNDICSPADLDLSISENTNDCSGFSFDTLYFEVEYDPIEYEVNNEYVENGFGKRTLRQRQVYKIHSFRFIADDYWKSKVAEIVHRTERIQIDVQAPLKPYSFPAYEVDFEFSEVMNTDLYECTVSFKIDAESNQSLNVDGLGTVGVGACCSQLYTEAPYEDPCSGEPGGQDCDTFDSTVTESGGTLSVSVSGGQGQDKTAWFYKAPGGSYQQLTENATSVSLGGYGTYRAVTTEGGCKAVEEFPYLDPCGGFDVRIRQNPAGELIAEVTNGGSGLTYDWQEYVNNSWSSTGETSSSYYAEDPGQYRVIVQNDSSCEDSDIVTVESASCPWTLSIAEDNGTLEAKPSDNQLNYTYSWEINRADGNGYVDLNLSTKIINKTDSGSYRVTVEDENGCIKTEEFLYINCGDVCDDTEVNITKTFGQLDVVLNPQPNQSEFTWFLWEDGDDGFIQIASGNTVNTTNNGIYKVRAEWDDCIKEAVIPVNDCN